MRACLTFRGTRAQTGLEAAHWMWDREVDDELWVGDDPPADVAPTRRNEVVRWLGRSVDVVVLDLHDGLDADLIGQAHGLVRGGGALILRLPERLDGRFGRRFEAALARADFSGFVFAPHRAPTGTAEQADAIATMIASLSDPSPRAVVLIADRGRGKTFALERVRDALPEVIIVDEAAQVGVAALQAQVLANPTARFAFATTVHGYEGTGRGFALRFVRWLESVVPVVHLTLSTPIRWDPNDPLERFVFDALLLDAEPDVPVAADATIEDVQRDTLSERDLRALFGLLAQAHYRTTPNDLQRLLDGPNIGIHLARAAGAIVAACLVAREGQLDEPTIDAMQHGRVRVAAQALADVLVTHLGHPEAGAFAMLRSVRIATHPDARRRGLARALVEHVHRRYDVDLFGTLFGATEDLVAFRRSLGYEVVRVSASVNTRSGEPSVMMLRPVTERAFTLLATLRSELASELSTQLALLRTPPPLAHALAHALPPAAPADPEAGARRYAASACTFESVAAAIRAHLAASDLGALSASDRALVNARVFDLAPWDDAARAAGLSTPAAMRQLRRIVRRLVASSSIER